MEVGKRYKLKGNEFVVNELQNKMFTVTSIDDGDVHVKIDDVEGYYHISIDEFYDIASDLQPWDGNILLHRFI